MIDDDQFFAEWKGFFLSYFGVNVDTGGQTCCYT